MLQILKIEWLKVKNYRAFWILFCLYILAIFGANIIAYSINNQIKGNTGQLVPSLYAFPTTWHMTAYVSTFLFLFPGLLIINHTGNEFSFKTNRQNIIDGWSRKQFITVKLLFAVIISFVATIAVFLTGLLLGTIASKGGNESMTENLHYIPYFFLQTLLYCVFAVFIVTWVRKSGLSIGIYFGYCMIIENIISSALFWTFREGGNEKFNQVLPLQSSDSLIRTPKLSSMMPFGNLSDTTLIILTLGYIALFSFLSYRSYIRKDL
jgi:ABC-2 type transport system permease protein